MTIEQITDDGLILAIVISGDHIEDGLHFITPVDFSQQLAYMHHTQGKIITPHTHIVAQRQVSYTQEVLVIKRGKLRVDFYNSRQEYQRSRILSAGDILLLAFGGHGFEVLEELEMIEIKQGPYSGEQADKIKFNPVTPEELNFS